MGHHPTLEDSPTASGEGEERMTVEVPHVSSDDGTAAATTEGVCPEMNSESSEAELHVSESEVVSPQEVAVDTCSSSSSPSTPTTCESTTGSSVAESSLIASQQHQFVLPTYKLVGDNIDKKVVPREMRSDYQARSLHYFHTYAVRDRVNLTDVSDQAPHIDLSFLQQLQQKKWSCSAFQNHWKLPRTHFSTLQ